MPYAEWGQLLSEHFPARDSIDDAYDWAALQQSLAVDQPVIGVVIAKAPFGAWLDIGVGFPALLEFVCIEGLTPERYRLDEWCPIGSKVSAFVGGFNDRNRQVGLWQVRPID